MGNLFELVFFPMANLNSGKEDPGYERQRSAPQQQHGALEQAVDGDKVDRMSENRARSVHWTQFHHMRDRMGFQED